MSYNVSGVFSPFFGSQLTRDWTILEITTDNPNFSIIRLKFVSTPTVNKEDPTGKFTIEYFNGSWVEEDILTGIELNHARNFSSWRRDLVHWRYDSINNTEFEVWNYGNSGTKIFIGEIGNVSVIDIDETDALHYIGE